MAPQRKTSRRQFLQGESLVESLDAATLPADSPAAKPAGGSPSPQEQSATTGSIESAAAEMAGYLVSVQRQAMACDFELLFNAGQHAGAEEHALAALDLVDALEDQLTVYRDHSEVSRINQRAAAGPVPVEPRLFGLLQLAKTLSAETGGALDITAGPLIKVWGFYRRQGQMPDEGALAAAMERVGSRHLELDEAAQSARFAREGLEINLGAIGKGYALDRCAELLVPAGVFDFVIHGGQSSVLARGSRAGRPDGGWTVGVRHPLRPERRLLEIDLKDEALGTSGSGTQFFTHRGRRYGHILDPRTGRPADGVLSSTVIAPTAAEADALSTACYVLGVDAALQLSEQRPGLGVILVTAGAKQGTIVVHHRGVDAGRWRLLESA